MEILKTKRDKPPRILIHADHKVGKSSLAASAPDSIFINLEDGLDEIDTSAFQKCETFNDVTGQIDYLYNEEHDFKTLVIDSIDWLETIINQHVCTQGGKESIADFGYGTGYTAALENFGKVINALDMLRAKHNMIIILLAHSQIKTYQNPAGSDYDQYRIKLREKNAELFLEWCDLIGFMHFQVFAKQVSGGFQEDRHKAVGGTERVLSVAPHAAYTSGNRYSITEDISLPDPQTGWNNLVTAIKGA